MARSCFIVWLRKPNHGLVVWLKWYSAHLASIHPEFNSGRKGGREGRREGEKDGGREGGRRKEERGRRKKKKGTSDSCL
jgi:hypothetical protein